MWHPHDGTVRKLRRLTAEVLVGPERKHEGALRAPGRIHQQRSLLMTLGTILIILLILALIGAIPSWGYSRNWGYGPSGILGLVLVVVLVLALMNRI
jgi:hypothetical protein